jgi:hypothetical protein
MRVELEKKIDHLFKNTRMYNDLVDELIIIGEQSENKEQFDNNMNNVWNQLVDKYIMKQPFYEYLYKSYLMNKNSIEYIQVQIDAKLDKEKFEEHKQNIEREIEEKERILRYRYHDDSYMNDFRVTDVMKTLYKEALVETESTLIKNPHYILDHMDKTKLKFYEYLVGVLSDENMNGIKKKVMLENAYTKYMSHMTGIEVVLPEELKYI